MEARKTVELETAALAAARRNEDDLRQMNLALDSMRYLVLEPAADSDPYFEGDVQFHASIARSTDNEIFTFTVMVLHDLLLRNIAGPCARQRRPGGQWMRMRRSLPLCKSATATRRAKPCTGICWRWSKSIRSSHQKRSKANLTRLVGRR
jgi:DNA-binding FadR family transcriptional regulator